MNKIEVKILNPQVVSESEQMMVTMARLTQRGHKITNMKEFEELLSKPYTDALVDTLTELPHPTIQKFGVINVMIVGASRRFLAQITRHQNEVKFMSGSLQYSDYSDVAQFVVPYEIIKADREEWPQSASPGCYEKVYLNGCKDSMDNYTALAKVVGNDAAGYVAPQGLRNVLLISATPYQLKHMIRQRTCNRNTLETQYVMLRIWKELYEISNMFCSCGPFCTRQDTCPEGIMCCNRPFDRHISPNQMLEDTFKYLEVYKNGN